MTSIRARVCLAARAGHGAPSGRANHGDPPDRPRDGGREDHMTRPEIYRLIDDERARQMEVWNKPHAWGVGDCSSPRVPVMVKVAVLAEEAGEVARAALDTGDADTAGLRREL